MVVVGHTLDFFDLVPPFAHQRGQVLLLGSMNAAIPPLDGGARASDRQGDEQGRKPVGGGAPQRGALSQGQDNGPEGGLAQVVRAQPANPRGDSGVQHPERHGEQGDGHARTALPLPDLGQAALHRLDLRAERLQHLLVVAVGARMDPEHAQQGAPGKQVVPQRGGHGRRRAHGPRGEVEEAAATQRRSDAAMARRREPWA